MDSSKVRKDSSSVTSCSSEDTSECEFVWDVSPSVLTAEVQALRKHKDWADKKIDLLIRRVREAEGPQRSLKEEVRQLRQVSSLTSWRDSSLARPGSDFSFFWRHGCDGSVSTFCE